MNRVDSSGWLEYFADGPNAIFFLCVGDPRYGTVGRPDAIPAGGLQARVEQRGEGDALQAVALMRQGQVVELDSVLALSAARLGVEHRLALADSVIYATARRFGALLWTQDADFESLPGVRFVAKYHGQGG